MRDTIREAVTNYLKEHELVKENLGGRIFPEVIPQHVKEYPSAVISRTFVERKFSKTGLTGISESRLNISVISERKLDAVRASDAIETALSGYSGDMNGVFVKMVVMDDQDDLYDHTVDLYQVTTSFRILHVEE